jgi:hypothetical protein
MQRSTRARGARRVPLTALVSVDDLRRLEQLDREWDERTDAIQPGLADIPVEELEAKIDEIIAEGRARRAAERRSA